MDSTSSEMGKKKTALWSITLGDCLKRVLY